mgnify:CR=1 FL=1
MTKIEEQFCEELQELLDRYKTQLKVPTIMRNAQRIFHNTLSIRYHPELHPYAKTELDYLKEFIAEGPRVKIMHEWIDELEDVKKAENATEAVSSETSLRLQRNNQSSS